MIPIPGGRPRFPLRLGPISETTSTKIVSGVQRIRSYTGGPWIDVTF
jgi:hypothetical protein